MFELNLLNPEDDAKYLEAAYALKDCLKQLIKKDKPSFLTLLAVVLKLQIERPDLIEEREAVDATEIAQQLFEIFKKAHPDNFEQVIDAFFEGSFQDGVGEPPKEISNYVFMLFVIDFLRDKMKEKEKANITE